MSKNYLQSVCGDSMGADVFVRTYGTSARNKRPFQSSASRNEQPVLFILDVHGVIKMNGLKDNKFVINFNTVQ